MVFVPVWQPASVIFEYLCHIVFFSEANKYSQSVSKSVNRSINQFLRYSPSLRQVNENIVALLLAAAFLCAQFLGTQRPISSSSHLAYTPTRGRAVEAIGFCDASVSIARGAGPRDGRPICKVERRRSLDLVRVPRPQAQPVRRVTSNFAEQADRVYLVPSNFFDRTSLFAGLDA